MTTTAPLTEPHPLAESTPQHAGQHTQEETMDSAATTTAVSHDATPLRVPAAAAMKTDPSQTEPKGAGTPPPPAQHKTIGPKSSYYFGPPGKDRAFGTAPCGVIGRDKPREIVRIERDYSTGELPQFHPAFPLELEGRISPTTFSELVNDINVLLISAHSPARTWIDNTVAILTFYLSPYVLGTHHGRKIAEVESYIDQANRNTLNPHGLNLLSPRKSGYLFIELEYY